MKISPVPSISVPTVDSSGAQAPSRVDALRSLKMVTDSTPLPNQLPEELPISDNNRTAEAKVEATQPLSPQLAELARRRRALDARERELARRLKEVESQKPVDAIDVSRLKSQPLSVLLENGVTYDQLTEAILANQGNSEVNALKSEIENLKKSIDQKFVDNEQASRKQILAEMRNNVSQLVAGDGFELVRETRSVPLVMQLIERTFDETGRVLSENEACKLVEDELFLDAQKIARIQKVQSQLSPPTPQPVEPQQRSGMRTLTNKDTASVPMSAKQRAMAAFYGQLRK